MTYPNEGLWASMVCADRGGAFCFTFFQSAPLLKTPTTTKTIQNFHSNNNVKQSHTSTHKNISHLSNIFIFTYLNTTTYIGNSRKYKKCTSSASLFILHYIQYNVIALDCFWGKVCTGIYALHLYRCTRGMHDSLPNYTNGILYMSLGRFHYKADVYSFTPCCVFFFIGIGIGSW